MLTNMARTKKESKKEETSEYIEDKYPWGLSINLDQDSLEKLGIKDLPAVGESIKLEAKVDVVEISECDSANGGTKRSMSLQITDLGLMVGEKSAADKMYGSKEES